MAAKGDVTQHLSVGDTVAGLKVQRIAINEANQRNRDIEHPFCQPGKPVKTFMCARVQQPGLVKRCQTLLLVFRKLRSLHNGPFSLIKT